jgi:hypothetical protein
MSKALRGAIAVGLCATNSPELRPFDSFGAKARHDRASGRDACAWSRESINRQVNETPIINDSEKGWAGSGSTDYRRETEILRSRD